MEKTLIMIKPDAVSRGLEGKILDLFQSAGLTLVAARKVQLTAEAASVFYQVHRERPFFSSLVAYISSGPLVAAVLAGPDAVVKVRGIMGATDPAKAEPGTVRQLHGESIERNAVHGSDSPESASAEIPFFFSTLELLAATGGKSV